MGEGEDREIFCLHFFYTIVGALTLEPCCSLPNTAGLVTSSPELAAQYSNNTRVDGQTHQQPHPHHERGNSSGVTMWDPSSCWNSGGQSDCSQTLTAGRMCSSNKSLQKSSSRAGTNRKPHFYF